MPTLEQTLPLLGRIRAGDKVATKSGNTRPNRLDHFRLTSDNKPRLDYAVKLGWGDEVTEWADAPEGRQWQLYCTVESLAVVVPHIAAFSQYDELWSGAECIYRCDGQTVLKGLDGAIKKTGELYQYAELEGLSCQCDQFPERVPTVTRVSLYLPDLPGIGVWRLDTRGFYAGSELQGIVYMLQEAMTRGMRVEADLAITQRKVRRDGQTRVFPVPTLQPREMTMRQILQLEQSQAVPLIAMPSDDDVYGTLAPPSTGTPDSAAQDQALLDATPEATENRERSGKLHLIKHTRTSFNIALQPFIAWIEASEARTPCGLRDGLARASLAVLQDVHNHLCLHEADACTVLLGQQVPLLDDEEEEAPWDAEDAEDEMIRNEDAEDAQWLAAQSRAEAGNAQPGLPTMQEGRD